MKKSISSGAKVNAVPCSRCGREFYAKTRSYCNSCNTAIWKKKNQDVYKSTRIKADQYVIQKTTAEEWDSQLMSYLRQKGIMGVSSPPRIIERGSEEFRAMEKLYGGGA